MRPFAGIGVHLQTEQDVERLEMGVAGLFLTTLVGLNLVIPRFFCRVLCPLGALLGVLSRYAALLKGIQLEEARDAGEGAVHARIV